MTGFVPRYSRIVKPASDGMARRAFSTRVLGAGASALLPRRAQSAAPDRVSTFVDFSSRIASRSMSGFLNSIHHPNQLSERIGPLQPKLWRSNDLRPPGVSQSWGAKFEGALSGGWWYPLNGNWKPPYENVAAWEAFVRQIAELSRGRESTGTSGTSPTRSGAGVELGTRSSRPGYEQQRSSRQRWVWIPRSARARHRFSRRSSKDSGTRTVNTLPVIYDEVLDVRDDQVSFGLDSVEFHEVYAIRVEEV
jgi:hypothetical protein